MNHAELNLDQMLAELADDVPPMPADLHDKWINAVRAENGPKTKPAPVSLARWTRILSVAAVFVFLIGGTFVYRASRKAILPENAAVNAAIVPESGEVRANAAETSDTEAVYVEEAAEAMEAESAAMEEAAEAYEAKEYAAASAATGTASETADAAMDSAGEAPFMQAAEEDAGPAAATDTPETESAGEVPSSAAVTSIPESRGLSGFFADMGDFLLAVWPYLLIAAVPPAVALCMKKFKKK